MRICALYIRGCQLFFVTGYIEPKTNQRWMPVDQLNTIVSKVPFVIVQHFTHKARVISMHAEANINTADWLLSIFVN